ncbi:DUF2341 domain-containing protein [Candidatus Roizmanbacteria bacterium]|nr:DUF2341 domain-containing protein [Candidatus Roizmanbacteria bacterium]
MKLPFVLHTSFFRTSFIAHRKSLKLLSGVFLALVIAGAALLFFTSRSTEAAWYDDDWHFRKKLTIDADKVSGSSDLSNFPVLVSRTDPDLATHAQSDGDDIVFATAGGTKLSHEIESYISSTGELITWVNVTTLGGATDTDIYMYYGNAEASNQEAVASTWNSNYKGVWHLNQGIGVTAPDSTGINNLSDNNVVDTAAGKIDGASDLENKPTDNQKTMRITDAAQTGLDITQSVTVEAWVKVEVSEGDLQFVAGKDGAAGSRGYGLGWSPDDTARLILSGDGTNITNTSGSTPLIPGTWYYMVGVFGYVDGTDDTATVYVNGASDGSTATHDGGIFDHDKYFAVGGRGDSGQADTFDGIVDEVRVSNTNRSADWIATTFNNQSDPINFFASVSEQEEKEDPVAYWKFDEGQGTTVYDSSSNSNDATLGTGSSAPSWLTEDQCISGKCLRFDGNSDYVTAPNSGETNITSNAFSLSGWVKLSDYPSSGNYASIVSKGGVDVGAGYELLIKSTGEVFLTKDANFKASVTTVPLQTWTHVAGVYDGSKLQIYINGSLDASGAASGNVSSTSAYAVQIGRRDPANSNTAYLDSQIDEVKIYPYARSADEIKQDYTARGSPHGVSAQFGDSGLGETLSDGLAGYWKMNELSANSCTGGANDSCDSSGNGNDGAWNGDATNTAAKFANGVTFDGTGDYISINDNSIYETSGQKTVSFWAYPANTNVGKMAISKYQDDTTEDGWRVLFASDGTIIPLIKNSAGTGFSPPVTSYSANTWVQVVVTWDTTGEFKFYTDGVYRGNTTLSGTFSGNTRGVSIGRGLDSGGSTNSPFNGEIDDVRIYNRVLSPGEVQALYNWAPEPVVYHKFDEGTGTASVVDSSGNEASGTINGTITNSNWVNGKFGKAFNFTGDDYITSTDTISVAGQSQFTVTAWVYLHSLGTTHNIFAEYIAASGSTRASFVIDSSNQIALNVRDDDGDGGTTNCISDARTLTANTWTHIAVVYNADINRHKSFINGVPITDSGSGGCNNPFGTGINSNKPKIGTFDGSSNFLNGYIDDFKMYHYARTDGQIIEDMNGGHPVGGSPVGSAVAYWKLDDLTGTTAQDSSTNNNDLTLNSASWTTSAKFGGGWNGTGATWLSRSDDDDFDIGERQDFSISMWVKSDSAANPGTDEYIMTKSNGATAGFLMGLGVDTGYPFIAIDDDTNWSGANLDDLAYDETDAYDGNWHHLVAVKTGNERLEMYLDGKPGSIPVISNTATGSLANSLSLIVGDLTGADDGNEFNGDIDEVKFFRAALTPDQIKTEFNAGKAVVMGSKSTTSSGLADNSFAREFCPPGDTATCNAPSGEWKLDEGSGTSANDTSGNGYTGTLGGDGAGPDVPARVNGKFGKGLNFDGSDDRITAGQVLDPGDTDDITITAWIYRTSSGADHVIVGDTGNQEISSRAGYALFINDTDDLRLRLSDGTDHYDINSTATIQTGRWYFVAGVFDQDSDANSTLYINGVRDEESTTGTIGDVGSLDNSAQSQELMIGATNSTSIVDPFAGIIDQVHIYEYARTPAQIAWEYSQGAPVVHYKFDECQGTTANNSGIIGEGNVGHDGTITIGATGSNDGAGTCNSGDTSEAWANGTTGKINASIHLDGTNDYVTAADDPNLDFIDGEDFTISMWVKPTSVSAADVLAAKKSGTGAGNTGYYFGYFAGGQPHMYVSDGTDQHLRSGNSTIGKVNAGEWNHVIAVYRDDVEIRFYVNGIDVSGNTAQDAIGTVDSLSNGLNLTIGAEASDFQLPIEGQIDEFKLFRYALTEEQIRNEYNNGAVSFK